MPFERVGRILHLVGDECLSRDDRLACFSRLGTDSGEHSLVIPKDVIAFSTVPGYGCESAEFGLRKYGVYGYSWEASCKTAYTAGDGLNFLRCHLSVIAMLDHAQELGLLRWIDDESGYWERRDWVDLLLQYRGGEITRENLLTVSDQLYEWFGPLREKSGVRGERRVGSGLPSRLLRVVAHPERQTIRIGVSGQPPAKVLFFGRLQAADAIGDHFLVKCVEVIHPETQVADARWNRLGGNGCPIARNVRKVQGQRASWRLEFGPLGRLESDWQSQEIAVEGDGSSHVADENDGVTEFGH